MCALIQRHAMDQIQKKVGSPSSNEKNPPRRQEEIRVVWHITVKHSIEIFYGCYTHMNRVIVLKWRKIIYMEIWGSLLKPTVTKLSGCFHAALVIHRGIIHLTCQQSCQQSQLRLKILTLTVQESQPSHFLHHSPRPFKIMLLKSSWSLLMNNGHLKKVHDSA